MPDPVKVRLKPHEVRDAALKGITRQILNLYKMRPDAHGCPKDVGWQVHIDGAIGELAVAKHLNRYWNASIEDLDADDVGSYQVRTSPQHNRRLILHDNDPDDRAFIFVTGEPPELHINGWLYARDGKKEEFWSDPSGKGRPAYFVGKEHLNPMSTLP